MGGSLGVLLTEVLNEKAEALVQIEFLEKLLAPAGVADEGRGNEIGQHFRVVHFAQVTIDFFRQLAPALFEAGVEFEHFRGERVGFNGELGARFERLDARDGEGGFLFEVTELHPANALQDKVRGAVASADAGTDQAHGADREKVVAGAPLLALWPNECDAKHAVILEGVFEHFAKARLKNVEWEQRVGEEEDAGQRHDGNSIGKFDSLWHGRRVLLFSIRAPGAAELAESELSRDVYVAERDVSEGRAEAVELAT